MPYELRGKGVITGISIAKVMKLGEDLQSYIDAYTPGTAEEEVSKIKEALAYAAAGEQGAEPVHLRSCMI